ncbi:MAG: type II toxin-antitoxin system VapC family toxin [Gammaproteobacteria bacterium]|nr:type II toxin-antitoxin system VapC family toxin [Gammaproteobacteria bacterium]
MIILDTNIISELMKPVPNKTVIAWLDQQSILMLYTTSISVAEIYYGLQNLPTGKRRNDIETSFHQVIQAAFNQRILAFDVTSAACYGILLARRKNAGIPMSTLDAQIAAIATAANATLATRNTKDFLECDIDIINPFEI